MNAKSMSRNARLVRGSRALGLSTLALVAVSGCGALQPGAAATVNGSAITQNEVDVVVESLCNYVEAANRDNPSPQQYAVAELRATVTEALISFDLLDGAATDLGLQIEPSEVQVLAAGNRLPDGLDESDTERLETFFTAGAESQVVQETIGAHVSDPAVTSSLDAKAADIQAAGDYVTDYFGKQDVVVNPSYGSWDGSTVSRGSGSLSDPVSAAAKAGVSPAGGETDLSGLPPSQVCG